MTTKAITFIGNAPYAQTTYTCADGAYTTRFMPVATAMIFKPDQLYVLETDDAKKVNGDALRQELSETDVTFKRIPEGYTLDEFWQIFGIIAELVEPEDDVIFDFTGTFRSIPLLSLLAAAYVRVVVEGVTIKRIIYGAYQKGQAETPILDLTVALTLLDWINATTSFRETGRANFDALLQNDDQLKPISEQLQALSTNLYTSRTAAILTSAYQLQGTIADVQTTPQTEPFRMLIEQIKSDAEKMALADPTDPSNSREALEKMLNLIDWYIEKEMINQALTYAREWLVSLVLYRNGQALFVNHEQRNRAARAITEEPTQRQQQRQPEVHFEPERIRDIREVWRYLEAGKIRNDVAHCGMNPGALPANEIVNGANQIAQKLRALLPEE